MKILIISDIHANLTALDAVLTDAGHYEAVWFLGDLVGYGPDPNECVARLQELPNLLALKGNHDAAVMEDIDISTFNIHARLAIQWSQQAISSDSLAFLRNLKESIEIEQVTLVHGSPRQPVWEYLLDSYTVTENFDYFQTPYCFVGHTHLPVVYHLDNQHRLAERIIPETGQSWQMQPRAIINPGSVGQPRDRNPEASYCLYDPEAGSLQFCRVAYDIAAVQARMQTAGLPQRHINRLEFGW